MICTLLGNKNVGSIMDLVHLIDKSVQKHKQCMDFILFYSYLKQLFYEISCMDFITPEIVESSIQNIFEHQPRMKKTHTWTEREQNTYCSKTSTPRVVHIPLSMNRRRDILYKAYFGYTPHYQFPKLIDFATALADNKPPPYLAALKLWKCLNIEPLPDNRNIVINTTVPDRTCVREYRVVNADGLQRFCQSHDVSAGEVFSSHLWCTCITFDIDGKTCDSSHYDTLCIYRVDDIVQEIIKAMHKEMIFVTNGIWDMTKDQPPVHVWYPDKDTDKLSLRISVHFPENICIKHISDLSVFARKVCHNLIKCQAKHLVLPFLESKIGRYEKSLGYDKSWYRKGRISIVDDLRKLKNGEEIELECKHENLIFQRNDAKLFVEVRGKQQEIKNIETWIRDELDVYANLECLVDLGIYHPNKSLRLPLQSKIENGKHVRKFLPRNSMSTVFDALIHYPHTDMKSLGGDPILITYMGPKKLVPSKMDNTKVEKAKEFIQKHYSLKVTKITERNDSVYLDVVSEVDSNYCLIKEDTHKNAKMFFIFDRHGNLCLSCWSTNCQKKSKRIKFF